MDVEQNETTIEGIELPSIHNLKININSNQNFKEEINLQLHYHDPLSTDDVVSNNIWICSI